MEVVVGKGGQGSFVAIPLTMCVSIMLEGRGSYAHKVQNLRGLSSEQIAT
jgi:hypothetical protein